VHAEQTDNFDYFSGSRGMIRNGVQAVLTCNGLFTSNRTLNQVFKQELAYLNETVGDVAGGNYKINRQLKLVSVGGGEDGQQVSAVFREGLGCVVMSPNQDSDDIASLPRLKFSESKIQPAKMAWPQGDLVIETKLSEKVNLAALNQASNWAFERDTPEQDTLSLLIVHQGKIIHERYAADLSWTLRWTLIGYPNSVLMKMIHAKTSPCAMC